MSLGGTLQTFWVQGHATGKGIDFTDTGMRNGIDLHNFGIRNGTNFLDFGTKNIRLGILSKNGYKVWYTFSETK